MRLLLAATTVVAVAALIAPGAALAKGKHKKGQPSAVDVYVEQASSAGGNQTAPPTGNSSSGSSSYVVPLKSKAKQQLKHRGGKDTKLLKQLATHSFDRRLATAGNATQPGTFNAAFDIGAGPGVLFALVLGTALFLAVGGGLRGWRRRRAH
jgi:hypothetical protein